ncbi:winged helix-turn-helix transcriptional regulator [Chryseobacterium sp. CFS15]|uniref:winged helix-turn-helix transcriptional regulator n=1 Tax=Chryseobacterium sp. CFS15 TaxID=2986946 RepID=UPI002809EB0A|nr:winged helix-turn-helix transcriptional regulator [Chryseobacterium sp. CFS15]MDQ8141108.1 winged helix-turn-helix transcriptional regulator [Chryseobacterium sp. CFS15]
MYFFHYTNSKIICTLHFFLLQFNIFVRHHQPLQKNTISNLKSQAIYIDGKDITDEIESYSFEGGKCVVLYKNTRKVYHEVPPEVEYAVSETGMELIPFIKHLHNWGNKQLKKEVVSCEK